MIFVSLLCCVYAQWQFKRRLRAIRENDVFFNFESVWGPTSCVCFVVRVVLREKEKEIFFLFIYNR